MSCDGCITELLGFLERSLPLEIFGYAKDICLHKKESGGFIRVSELRPENELLI